MTPKEKAKQLVKHFYNFVGGWTSTNRPNEKPTAQYEGEEMRIGRAKQCAYIAVDEILSLDTNQPYQEENYIQTFYSAVKQEIQKL